MSPSTSCPINVLLKLFNALVALIALYGAEIWGLADVKSRNNKLPQQLMTVKDPIAHVNSKTNNIASLRELGV